MGISIVSFSGRAGGNCSGIAACLAGHWGGRAQVFDFSALSIVPCGRCGYECFQARENCPYFGDSEYGLCEAIAGSALACFIIPNYCDYPCANFFIFNERSQCYFQRHPELLEKYLAVKKKFIVVSNTGQDNFTAAMRYHVAEGVEPEILFLSAREFGRVSIRGDLMEAAEAREAVLRFVERE